MPTWHRNRAPCIGRLATQLRQNLGIHGHLGPAVAAALMNRTPVRTVKRLGRLSGCDVSTLHREFRSSTLARPGVTPRKLLVAFLLVRVAEMPPSGRTWTAAAAHLGVTESRLRSGCRYWLGSSPAAATLAIDDVVGAIQAKLGMHKEIERDDR